MTSETKEGTSSSPRPQSMHVRGDHTYDVIPMDEDQSLPDGWRRKLTQRLTGKSAGKYDVYIYSPEGKKFRSRLDLATYFAMKKIDLNADDFDFSVRGKGAGVRNSPSPRVKKTPQQVEINKAKTREKKKRARSESRDPGKKRSPSRSPKKATKTLTEKLVVKMKFSTPPKTKYQPRKSGGSSEKKTRKGGVMRSMSESSVSSSIKKRALVAKAEKLQRSLSLQTTQKSLTQGTPPNVTKLRHRSSPIMPILEKNNNDVNWTTSPMGCEEMTKINDKKRNSPEKVSPSKSGHPFHVSPPGLTRTLSENTAGNRQPDTSPRSRRKSVHTATGSPSTGEEFGISKAKRRKYSENY